ncbi:MAG TPA: phosphate acyltransferase PlsX [Rickettsiales bacterium]|nr:phosphate acyltransferase PlsX [Rickettsiales bacterium]
MDSKIVIALDCMGGDNAPASVIEGLNLLEESIKDNSFFLLYGDERKINKYLLKYPDVQKISKVYHTETYITGEDKPSLALRKRDSSIRLAIDAVKSGEAHAAISAGNTGALMGISKMILKTIPGIDRPALITLIPNFLGRSTALLDMGANIDCDSTNLFQFAIMGSAFYKAARECSNPKIAILNVGSEEMKGNDAVKNASQMLKESNLKDNFLGYIEGDDIMKGLADVVVTDGFTGNVALKAMEGASKFFASVMKDGFSGSIMSKIGYLLASSSINKAKKKIDHKQHNGAMLVGLNGIVVKSHGNADKISFAHAIRNTINLVKNKINDEIISSIQLSDFEQEENDTKD